MSIILDVVKVEAKQNYLLNLEFNNGEKRVFDMAPFINKDPFNELKGSPLFEMAYIEYGTVVWPGEIDISQETLYLKSMPA
jgi:Protein of unknown function (DUF2442)